MRWQKLGLIYTASGEESWAQSHAHVPTPFRKDENTLRVYVTFLDSQKIGRIGYVDLDSRDPKKILKVSKHPVLEAGEPGMFDENGVIPMCVVRAGHKVYLFYTGWQLGHNVRYYLMSGLAVSDDGGETFVRVSQVPVLDRQDGEIFVRSTPWLLQEADRWRMWYIAGDRWIEDQGKLKPTYGLRYLESGDLTLWHGGGKRLFDPQLDEFGISRPVVFAEENGYGMLYSIRIKERGYRIGYARSLDGIDWKRQDQLVGIDASASGWDSEMICFGVTQELNGKSYLLYNGNNYGETGFGLAVRTD